MSQSQHTTDQHIHQILDELDHPEAIQASPGFHQRVMNRIQDHGNSSTLVLRHSWQRQWLRPALLAAMIILNVTVMTQVWHSLNQRTVPSDRTTSETAVLAAEYGYELDSDLWAWSQE